ncbi:MAG: hypothetical protein PHN63_04430 [Candidatus Omnitrophica bacterium]|nr:hypothetical protein [Candidatus Omnitrophota bacterium]
MEELKLPQKVARLLREFTDRAQEIYREELISVILYGSAASGEFSAAHSNVNLVVVLKETGLASLSKIAPLLNKGKLRAFNIVFFTENYIKNSADVFPIEFLDIKENHKILYGKDVVSGLDIDIKNLRFQCEQELRSKIINIKKAYLASVDSPDLDKLLLKFFTSSLHILRNVLRLKSGNAVYRKEDILNAISAGFHIDTAGMRKILEARGAGKRLPKRSAAELFNSFVADLEKISDEVDGHKG